MKDNTLKRIVKECEAIAAMQSAIKSEAMTYQGPLKREIAADLGLAFEQVNLPYDRWAAIRDPWLRSHDR